MSQNEKGPIMDPEVTITEATTEEIAEVAQEQESQTYDQMVDEMAAMLEAEAAPDESSQEPQDTAADSEQHDDTQEEQESVEHDANSTQEQEQLSDSEHGSQDSENDDQDQQFGEEEKQEPELAADGLPMPKTDKARERIQQLVSRAKEAEAKQAEAEAALEEANQRAATTTAEHPDPDAELADLRQRYASVKTPQQILEEELINPLTNELYTPAEAQAAVAEYKQDLQFKINEAQNSTVERMNQARLAESLVTTQLNPALDALIAKFPQLDAESDKADKGLCDVLQAVVDANVKLDRGLVVGFKKDPKEFLGTFERMIKNGQTMKVNQHKETAKKIDKVPSKGALDNRQEHGKITPEQELMNEFDKAMAEMGYRG